MTNFRDKLDQALSEHANHLGICVSLQKGFDAKTKSHLLKESRTPRPGIYWWMPHRFSGKWEWQVADYWYQVYGESVVHPEIWNDFIAKELVSIFNLPLTAEPDLRGLYNALPRGRITTAENHQCQVRHGNDMPPGGSEQQILKAFYLPLETPFLFWDHETMDPDNYRKLCAIIGKDLGAENLK